MTPQVVNAHRMRNAAVAFTLHTIAVYLCALKLSPSLIGYSFRWFLAPLHMTASKPGDWYLQHLILITLSTSLLMGYAAVRIVSPLGAIWASVLPALIIAYKVLTFHAVSSALLDGTLLDALKYYFDIQQTMPSRANFVALDVNRVLAQMTITAPFVAGAAYSAGASLAILQQRSRLY